MNYATGELLAKPAIDSDTRANILVITIGAMVVVGLVAILVHRFGLKGASGEAASSSMTRPVLAILIVGTVLILAGASLSFSDAQARNMLLGGIVSLSSGAVAFYFASSGANEARKDLLTATSSTALVPDLKDKTATEAEQIMSGTHLMLQLPEPRPAGDKKITDQDPKPGSLIRIPATVKAIF
jgi:hypothetical protein